MTSLNDAHDPAILRLLAGGVTRSQALADALGIPGRTIQRHLRRLTEAGLVESPTNGVWRLSGAGSRAALITTVPEPVGATEALAELPTEHRAMLRLIEDAVIARRALGAVYPTNWPGFILLGPTKTGKTLLASLAVRRFGIDPGTAIVMLMRETEGSLLGRRVQTGPAIWEITPSPFLALPLIVLDEFDKASPELRQAAFAYLAGESLYRSEGTELHVAATAIVTLNDDGGLAKLLPDAYLRRSVVLDTNALVEATADLHVTARRLARAAIPVLGEALEPPATELPENAWDALGRLLQACLTQRGWGLVDVEAISRLVLGRAAQEPDLEAAVLGVAADYLLVTATRQGLVEPDWPMRFEGFVGPAVAPIATALEAARTRQATGEARQVTEEQLTRAATIELAGTRARLVDALDYALRTSPRTDLTDEERAGLATARGKAAPLREAIAGARSSAALLALEADLEREVLTPIRAMAEARDARRAQTAAARQRQQEDDRGAHRRAVEATRVAQETRRAAERDARSRRAAVKALCRRTTTRPGENVLDALLGADCLTRLDEQHDVETIGSIVANSPLGRAVRARLEPAKPPPSAPVDPWALYTAGGFRPASVDPPQDEPSRHYKTETWTSYEDHAGRRYGASDLVAWDSDAVRAVLEAAAEALGLPRSSWPMRRAATPAARAARASSRVRRG
ncbi:MAG: helix-turn-helix domain-containing protein [Candidatus Limnocylindrales bacterium]